MTEPPPPSFRVTVLGPFQVWRDDRPLGGASWQRSVQTLLKLLATSPEHRRLRDEVIDTLWPDATQDGGASNLRYVLGVLRRSLGAGEPPAILADRTWITLNPAYPWDIDLARFEALAPGVAADDAGMEELAELYRGEPLVEDRYEDWAGPLRAHVQQTWLQTCRRCAEVLRTRGEPQAALTWLERALETDSADEEAFRHVLQILIGLGRRGEAMRRFQRFERLLRSELDIEPSPETRAILSQPQEWQDEPVDPPAEKALLPNEGLSEDRLSQMLPSGAYLGALPTMPLVARHEELSRLLAGVDAAMEGQGKLVLLSGEPGVGKTRLAQEVTAELHRRGFRVATGRCYEPEAVVPYYPFLDVLADIAHLVPRARREEIPARWPYLVRLLPELQPAGVAAASTPPAAARSGGSAVGIMAEVSADEPLLIRAVAGFLRAVMADAPLAILLDDLHWSDSASVKLLLHLARHSGGQQLFLLGTYRDLDLTHDHPLHGALVDLGRERLMEKIGLRRLDAEGTKALIAETLAGAALPPGLVEIVHGPAEGNPFFVGEIVRSMVEEGDLFRSNGVWERRQSEIRVPESVRAVLGQRLSRLAEGTQTVVSAASVLGQAFRFDEVEHVSGLSETEVEAALDEAARAGLVRESRPDVYTFSHALAQGAVYGEMTGRRQRRLHLAAAETIEAAPEPERRAAEIASHFVRAGDVGRAIPYSILAGDAARDVFAHTEAERHYRSAVEASREIGDGSQEAAALERLAFTLLRQARHAEAEGCARQAANAYRHLGDREGELRTTCRLGEILQAQGKQREGFTALQALQDSIGVPAASPGLVQLHLSLAELAMDLGDYQQQEGMALKAVEIAEALGDRRLLVRAETYRQGASWLMGRPNDIYAALQAYSRSLEEDGDLVELARFGGVLALLAMLRGELRVSREYGEKGLDLARRIGDPMLIPAALSQLGSILFLLGDWQGARAHFERAISMARPIDTAIHLPFMLCNLGHLAVCEGDWDAGEALLREALKAVGGGEASDSMQLPHQFLANLDLIRGNPQAAIERLTPLLDRSGYEEWRSTPLLPPLAQAYLDLGAIEGAEQLARDAARRAESDRNRLDVVAALLVQAGVREKQGREDEALVVLEDVLRHAREMSFPAAEAEARFKLGSLELKSGDTDAARSHLVRAREIWQQLGARRDVERANDLLAKLPPPHSARRGPCSDGS